MTGASSMILRQLQGWICRSMVARQMVETSERDPSCVKTSSSADHGALKYLNAAFPEQRPAVGTQRRSSRIHGCRSAAGG